MTTNKYQTLSLKQAGESDHSRNVKALLSGWGAICKDREGKPFTRKARVKANKDARIKPATD